MNSLYLKKNVIAEPLFNQWYAWSYLIAPATSALYIANSHIKIMQSFINAPQFHMSALKNSGMTGSSFMNYDVSRVNEIKTLMEKTIKEQSEMLKFAEAVQELDNTLLNEANGFSMLSLYQKVPDILRGYVELVYDLNNYPSIRFIEGLLYKSPFYKSSSQSIALSQVDNDDRSFVFSTPRLPDDKHFHLSIPFSSNGIDELFKMRRTPQPYGYIKECLGFKDKDDQLLITFFTEEVPSQQPAPFDRDGVRVRYYGHACILIETKDVSILLDPVISYQHGEGIFRYTFDDLPDQIDYVLITHDHQDHCMFETLLQLRSRIKNLIIPRSTGGLIDPSLKLVLQNIGFKTVREIDEMEDIEIPGGMISGIPFLGEHADLNIRTKIAYFVKLMERSILCVADSNNIEPVLYRHIYNNYGDVDLLFIGMECDGAPMSWLYGPLLTKPIARKMDQSRRFDGSTYEKAINMVECVNAKQVYVYAMGQEPWLTFLTSVQYTDTSRPIIESNKLVKECIERGLIAERLYGHKEIIFS